MCKINTLLITTDARALRTRKFSNEGTVILNDINCLGTEDSLTDCPGGSVYGNFSNCLDIAVVLCEGMSCIHG